MQSSQFTIVEYYAEHKEYRCGYCNSANTNSSHGMWADSLGAHDYQDLIDRGWRRSGLYCYKPLMPVICCPAYTIKCAATDLKLTRSQKRVLKKIHRFLSHGDIKAGPSGRPSSGHKFGSEVGAGGDLPVAPQAGCRITEHMEEVPQVISIDPSIQLAKVPTQKVSSRTKENPSRQELQAGTTAGSVPGQDSARPVRKKAKLMRRERKKQKLIQQQGMTAEEAEEAMVRGRAARQVIHSLEDLLDLPLPPSPAHRLEVRLVRSAPQSRELQQTLNAAYDLYRRYQVAVHGDPPEKCSFRQFLRFLVNSPLQASHPEEGPPVGYGSFHQQYWLDGNLVAVGVLDILPRCVSSVYFFYDPDFSHLSLGTYSSLRELALTRSLHAHAPALEFYYMGFYIHSCPKMRYKVKYSPSFLLCPETYCWFPVEQCLPKLDQSKYTRFHPDPAVSDFNGQVALDQILVLWQQRAMPYSQLRISTHRDDEDEVKEYARLVGRSLSQRLLLIRS